LEYKIYGRADLGYAVSNGSTGNGATAASVTTSRFNQGQMASRFGLTGSWTLDPDMKAVFGVETGVNLFNGAAGGGIQEAPQAGAGGVVLFSRGATAGLVSNTWGSIEAGTMYMAPFWVALGADAISAHGYGASDLSGLWSAQRPEALGKYLKGPAKAANGTTAGTISGSNTGTALFYGNSMRFRTPKFGGGFTGEFSYTNGQQALGSNDFQNDGRAWAGNIMYSAGPLWAGYSHMNYTQVADVSTTTTASWQTRHQLTDIVGARYKWGDLTVGGSYTTLSVDNAGGYKGSAYGLSTGYDLGKNTFEFSVGRNKYENATSASTGVYGANGTAGQTGDPSSTSYGFGYLYNLQKNLTLYLYHMRVQNNSNANLGVIQFRGDNSALGHTASETTAGMFFVF
jgi:predicted porin